MSRRALIVASVAGALAVVAAILGAALLGGGWSGPGSAASIARGADLYAASCAACHGANLQGQPDWQIPNEDGTLPSPPHDDSGHTWHHADDLLFRYVKFGGAVALGEIEGFTSAMPGFADTMSDEDILDVLAFIKSRWSDQTRDYQREVTRLTE